MREANLKTARSCGRTAEATRTEREREEKNEEENVNRCFTAGDDDDDERSSHCLKGLRKCQRRRRGSRTAQPLFPAAAEFHR